MAPSYSLIGFMSNVYIIYMILSYLFWFFLNTINANALTTQNGIIPSAFKEGYYSLGMETTYLTTSANYTQKGTSLDFDSEYGYSAYLSTLYGRFDFSDKLSAFSELPLNYGMSESPTDNRSSFKASGLTIGLNYDFRISNFNAIAQINGYYALEQFDRTSDDVLTSDGANYLEVGSHFFKNFSTVQFHAYLAYEHRFDGFSGLLNYQTDLFYKNEKSSLGFGLKGFQSIVDDLNTDNPERRHDYLTTVNGSSLMYGSVNPSRLDLFTQAKFSLNDAFDFYGGITKSIRGENSGDILTFTVGLEYFFEPLLSPKKIKPRSFEEDFETDEEMDPVIEEQIKTYNKPIKEKPKPKPPPPPKPKPKVISKPKPVSKVKPKPIPKKLQTTSPKIKSTPHDLVISKKHLGKKTTSTSPIKSKPKSKKPKRIQIDF